MLIGLVVAQGGTLATVVTVLLLLMVLEQVVPGAVEEVAEAIIVVTEGVV